MSSHGAFPVGAARLSPLHATHVTLCSSPAKHTLPSLPLQRWGRRRMGCPRLHADSSGKAETRTP